ncbi:MAG: site-specific integrase [Sulfuriferula sp.]
MSEDTCLARLTRREWLTDGPLSGVIAEYIELLRKNRYAEHTITSYLISLAHYSYWAKVEGIELSSLNSALIKRFLYQHIPACNCPPPRNCVVANAHAALRHLLRLLSAQYGPAIAGNPIAAELDRFGEYLSNICGLAAITRASRVKHVHAFLTAVFGSQIPVISQISVAQLDTYFFELSVRWRPASLRTVCTSLRSYFRYRSLLGEPTVALAAGLPRLADWRHAILPKVLSDTELEAFLKAFDRTDPVGMRDYAMARCMLDLGLRGHEVTCLTLDAIDWHSSTLTISSTKSMRVQQLPLPQAAGEAIAQYLRQARPQTSSRTLFVRHRAPFDKPLGVPAIRNAMNRVFMRCGLHDRFCNTHVLRRTAATRLQRAGTSVKEIADFLRHQSLDTASTYIRVDLEGLRTVALPWPGSQS